MAFALMMQACLLGQVNQSDLHTIEASAQVHQVWIGRSVLLPDPLVDQNVSREDRFRRESLQQVHLQRKIKLDLDLQQCLVVDVDLSDRGALKEKYSLSDSEVSALDLSRAYLYLGPKRPTLTWNPNSSDVFDISPDHFSRVREYSRFGLLCPEYAKFPSESLAGSKVRHSNPQGFEVVTSSFHGGSVLSIRDDPAYRLQALGHKLSVDGKFYFPSRVIEETPLVLTIIEYEEVVANKTFSVDTFRVPLANRPTLARKAALPASQPAP